MVTQNIKKDKNLYKRNKTLGTESTKLLSQLLRDNQIVFTIDEAASILEKKKSKVWELLRNLTEKRWLKRNEKGKYLLLPLDITPDKPYTEHQFIIAAKLISHYHIGY